MIIALALAELGAATRTLAAHTDGPVALAALRDRGQRLVALANSPQAAVDAQLQHAGPSAFFDGVYSFERVRMLKPAPAAYQLVLQTEGVTRGPGGNGRRPLTVTTPAPRQPGCVRVHRPWWACAAAGSAEAG